MMAINLDGLVSGVMAAAMQAMASLTLILAVACGITEAVAGRSGRRPALRLAAPGRAPKAGTSAHRRMAA